MQELGLSNLLLKIPIWGPIILVFPRAQSASFLLSTLNYFQWVLKINSCTNTWFNPLEVDGNCQFVIDNIYTLLYKRNNWKDLLYIKRNSIKYSIIIYMKKKLKKRVDVCMYNNHFSVHLKLTQHCKSAIL